MLKTRAQLQLEALRAVREASKPAAPPVAVETKPQTKKKRKGKE